MKKPVILMILDGFGIAPEKGNAIKAAKKPNIDKLFASNPVSYTHLTLPTICSV